MGEPKKSSVKVELLSNAQPLKNKSLLVPLLG